jgi:hypothetical protein
MGSFLIRKLADSRNFLKFVIFSTKKIHDCRKMGNPPDVKPWRSFSDEVKFAHKYTEAVTHQTQYGHQTDKRFSHAQSPVKVCAVVPYFAAFYSPKHQDDIQRSLSGR